MRSDTLDSKGKPLQLIVEAAESTLKKNGFKITSEEKTPEMVDIHARREGARNIARGQVRDLDLVLAQKGGWFHIQLRVGIWGRDLLVPTLEAIPTIGFAAVAELESARSLERSMWEDLVHAVDPSLLICNMDGLTFPTKEDLKLHADMHEMLRKVREGERMLDETSALQEL